MQYPVVTAVYLSERGACSQSVEIFRDVFPKGACVTLDNLELLQRRGVNVRWTVDLLSMARRRELWRTWAAQRAERDRYLAKLAQEQRQELRSFARRHRASTESLRETQQRLPADDIGLLHALQQVDEEKTAAEDRIASSYHRACADRYRLCDHDCLYALAQHLRLFLLDDTRLKQIEM